MDLKVRAEKASVGRTTENTPFWHVFMLLNLHSAADHLCRVAFPEFCGLLTDILPPKTLSRHWQIARFVDRREGESINSCSVSARIFNASF